VAITHGMGHKNVDLRLSQFSASGDPSRAMELSRSFVSGKIRNARLMLRRNHVECPPAVLHEMARLARRASAAEPIETLLGVEGAAGRSYFTHFAGMLKEKVGTPFEFASRNRRPPRDPVNALLSFAYSLLAKELTVTALAVGFDPYLGFYRRAAALQNGDLALAVGFDPYLGFYHRPKYGRPALALDLMEEFRPLIADSVVLTAVNTGEVREGDFVRAGGAVALTAPGRRKFISVYERRMDSLVTHPTFGYAISYRRVLEVQARLLARYLTGELPYYRPFCTR